MDGLGWRPTYRFQAAPARHGSGRWLNGMVGGLSTAGKTARLLEHAAVRKSAGIGNPAIDIGGAESADVGQDHVGKAGGGFGIARLLGNEIMEGAKSVGFVDMVAAGGRGVAADEVHQAGKRGRVDIHTEPVLHLEKQDGKGVGKRHGADWAT